MRLDHLLSREEVEKRNVFYCWVINTQKFLVAMRLGDTPVPIPNTMVKTQAADGTALETVWESRWLPELQKNILPLDTSIYLDGGVAQLGEHLPCKQGVKSSNLSIST